MSSGEEPYISSYYLDQKAFHLYCKLFLQHSSIIRDGWSWAEVKGDNEGYIKKTAIIPGRFCSLLNHKADDGMNTLTGTDELDDEVAGAYTICESQLLMHYEYHVLYSFSHQVPILYFRATTLDGQPLSLHEVWSNIHPNYKERLLQRPWDTLTQQEHPFLGQPFFMLHPCHTEDFMGPLVKMAHAKKRFQRLFLDEHVRMLLDVLTSTLNCAEGLFFDIWKLAACPAFNLCLLKGCSSSSLTP
ncbi:ubiquitin-like-conjugating enzyme ATG10 isoform X3 [Neoarius graeffei]|uniref:ubiquitin-like-conjugating enzyme ATG10 isoform X3 n=1 Tax=Neoarius graeffei TaxID=443677 RepID=UPI00298C2F77|nr:ubiquitin-like-conjugating enzyme ATG10 isoform X3 [Neoarius graeffei]